MGSKTFYHRAHGVHAPSWPTGQGENKRENLRALCGLGSKPLKVYEIIHSRKTEESSLEASLDAIVGCFQRFG
jgi:hypothetical protein